MSTKALAARLPITRSDPETQPIMRLIGVAVRRIACRGDVVPKSVVDDFGSPARFIPSLAEIHVHKKWILQVDLKKVSTWNELVLKYPTIAGIILHEIAHSRFTAGERMLRIIHDSFGRRHTDVFLLLSEGHCESLLYGVITPWEQAAMRSMVLNVVLSEIPTDKDDDQVVKDIRMAFRMTGLLAARANVGVLDLDDPTTAKIYDSVVTAMGSYWEPLSALAVEFATVHQVGYDENLNRAHAIVKAWIELEDEAIKEAREQQEEEGENEGVGEKPKDKGQSRPDEGSEEPGESGESESSDGGADDEEEDDPYERKPKDEPTLGAYGKARIDIEAIRDALEDMRTASAEAETRVLAQMGDYSRDVLRANADSHAQRKENNRRAAARWQQNRH